MAFLASIRNSPTFQRILRVLQFLSAILSLAFFSARLYKILLYARRASHSNGAVEGILAAASAYCLAVMLLKFFLKRGGSNALRWLLVILDILFAIAFIAVAVLTRRGGSSGPCTNTVYRPVIPKGENCNLPWGVFILAIISTVLHLITAIFHEVKDHHVTKKQRREMEINEERGMSNQTDSSGKTEAQEGFANGGARQDGYGNGGARQNGGRL